LRSSSAFMPSVVKSVAKRNSKLRMAAAHIIPF
jgi:hypothetical protein